jgi:hypothetical protein
MTIARAIVSSSDAIRVLARDERGDRARNRPDGVAQTGRVGRRDTGLREQEPRKQGSRQRREEGPDDAAPEPVGGCDVGRVFDTGLSWKYDGRDPDPDQPGAVRLILRMTVEKATGYAA